MAHCTHCSLLCHFEHEGALAHCDLRKSLQDARTVNSCRIGGVVALASDAVQAATERLRGAQHILVTGHIQSVELSRIAVRLARQLDATLDLSSTDASFEWIKAVQSLGFDSTTFSEVSNRSDLIVLLGCDRLFLAYPLLLERLLDCNPNKKRTLLLLGNFSEDVEQNCRALFSDTIRWNVLDRDLAPLIRGKLLVNGKSTITQMMDASVYPVVVWPTGLYRHWDSEFYRCLIEAIRNASNTQRVLSLPLAGEMGTFQQTATWLTGFPGRIRFRGHVATYDPWLHSAARFVEDFSMPAVPTVAIQFQESAQASDVGLEDMPRIVFGSHPATCGVQDIFMPIGIAGVERPATLFRADTATSIHCQRADNTIGLDLALALAESLEACSQIPTD